MVPVYVKGGAWSNVEGELDMASRALSPCLAGELCSMILTLQYRPNLESSCFQVWASTVD